MVAPFRDDGIREWLSKLGTRASIAVASRSALRALPLCAAHKGARFGSSSEDLVLRLFRTNLVAWSSTHAFDFSVDLTHEMKFARTELMSKFRQARTSVGQALHAAADAAECATLGPADSVAAATIALRTVIEGSYASNARKRALAADIQALRQGKSIADVISSPLWYTAESIALADASRQLEIGLLATEHQWEVWLGWYADRIYGRPADFNLLRRWIKVPDVIWEKGAELVNPELARLAEEAEKTLSSGSFKEPELEPGPEFSITAGGLSLKENHPPLGLFDVATQRHLHERLVKAAQLLAQASRNVSNEHPGLSTLTSEYEDLIARPFDEIDVVAVWAVGAGLLANRDGFARIHDTRTMTGPLEPAHFALLQQTSEIHGGFILGFPQARELAERADQARISGEAMERVVSLARQIIEKLRTSVRQVDLRTQKFLAAVEEGLVEPGWRITRAGYAAYVVTRNALIAIGRLLNWANSAFATVVGGLALTQVDPGLVNTQFWIEFVVRNSPQILAFAEPFPELKIWLAAQIEAAKKDCESQRN